MGRKKIETIIHEKIKPYTLNEKGKSSISQLVSQYSYDLLIECIDIGVSQYFVYDDKGVPTEKSVTTFLNKLGGIAYNKSLSPIEQEILRIKNKCKNAFNYWNDHAGNAILNNYILALKSAEWSDEQIHYDLKNEVIGLVNNSHNWYEWSSIMERWIEGIKCWGLEDDITIEQNETILPIAIFDGLQQNFQTI